MNDEEKKTSVEEISVQDRRPQIWISEHHSDFLKTSYRVKETLFSGESEFQQIDIVDTYGHGKMLFNDGLAMVSERDEFVYHDMISHVPMFTHPQPRRVLVIGGGDGGTVREVIRHQSVEHCKLVEIDPLVVEGCKRHIPLTSAALGDPRVEVLITDGVQFVAETDEFFDVVIVDSTDPFGPAAPLFGEEFYKNVMNRLTEQGIVISQCESPFYHLPQQTSMLSLLNSVFPFVGLYNYCNLTYPGGMWSFSYASKGLCPLKDFDSKRVEASGLKFSWYNEHVHRASFALPEFQRRKVKHMIDTLTGEA